MKRVITAAAGFFLMAWTLAGASPPVDDFPVAELQYRNGSRQFQLHSPYGFAIKWDQGKASFYLYDKGGSGITLTADLEVFAKKLAALPNKAEVAWINTCGAPLYYGMPANMLSEIQNVLKRKRFKMAGIEEGNFVLCTCEATNLVLFAESKPRKQTENDR